jgi:hypothetical protein
MRVRIPQVTWMFVCCVCYVMLGRGVLTSRSLVQGVLPTLVRLLVWSRNLKNEEAMAHIGPQRLWKRISTVSCSSADFLFQLQFSLCTKPRTRTEEWKLILRFFDVISRWSVSVSCPGRLTPWKDFCSHVTGEWVEPRAVLNIWSV